ncbi:hypothetical protein KFL_000050030 [Klebsormidium nitens]|uniref:S-adenosyl-L-methionine-dependent methyltransferases superfamily protein n=1 Tax=Klebsormidium nitens TaxID=105231 RepID=A0A1Y1HMN6_KLENI|nr:hypothetical protein KFL_000050030 [Klebsormidium nitens]|eukprot:GAQ77866.1 hypothetical protein KFL_000050030 [Klebsormidium nitens]
MGSFLSSALCFGWPQESSPDWAPPASLHSRGFSTDRRPNRQSALRCATETPTVSKEVDAPQSARSIPAGSSQLSKKRGKGRTELPACLEDVPELSDDASVNNFGLDDDEVIVSEWNYSSDDPDIRVLARGSSDYNSKIEVVELARTADHPLAGATLLLLDTANNIHSVYFKHCVWTSSYYDDFATLPCLLPAGPIGLYGLGAGTAAHLLHHVAPERRLHAWELDAKVVAAARRWFDIAPLEASGFLTIYTGDALTADSITEGGFAGLIVDLFSRGAVLPELQDAATWRDLARRMRPGGRIMVNCGSAAVEPEVDPRVKGSVNRKNQLKQRRKRQQVGETPGDSRKYGEIVVGRVLEAMREAFPGEINVRTLGKDAGCSVMALTGELPQKDEWEQNVLTELRLGIRTWKQYVERT